jgi:hypothetical protein
LRWGTDVIQYLIVAVLVGLAALYVGSKYLPAGLRRRIVYLLAGRGGATHAKLARWLDTESSCGSCKACADPAPPAPAGKRVIKLHVR